MEEPVRLAVDLGTTHTVAVVRRGTQPPRALLFDGTPLLPSGVFVDLTGVPHTGRDGQRLGASDPQRFEPHPKRRVDEGTVLLGELEVPVEVLLAATLRRVAEEARLAGVDPAGGTVLTCPADWGQPRRAVLRAAAWRAGLGEVRLLDEPIAAATYCVEVLGQRVAPGQCLGVFDFGGGTFDVAVVRREPDGLRVLATGGLDDLGGLDVDSALVAHLGQLVAVGDAELWRRLSEPADAGQRRDRQAFWAEVRAAKEMLSRTSVAPVAVPGRPEPMHLTREELERVAGPLVARAVDETRRVWQRAELAPAGLLLVGGASRMPLVASRLHARLGVAPAVPEQPELPVAFGALLAPVRPGPPLAPTPPPVAGPTRPVRAVGVPPKKAGKRKVRAALVSALVFLLVGGLVTGAVTGGRWLMEKWDGSLNIGAGNGGDRPLRTVHTAQLSRDGASAVVVAGERVVYAVAGGGSTEVTAVPAAGGAPAWTVNVPVEPSEVRLTSVADLIVLDAKDSATDRGATVRVVLNAADGKQLWKKAWEKRTDVVYLGTQAIVEVRDTFTANAVLRVELRTGKELWKRTGDDDSLSGEAHRIEPQRRWPSEGPAGVLPLVGGALGDALVAGVDTVVELNADDGKGYLLDARTGRAKASGSLPLRDEEWTVYGGLVVGLQDLDVTGGRAVLAGYKLPGFGRAWTVPLTQGLTVERVKPCGPHLVCMAVENRQDDETVAVDVRSGKVAWRLPVDMDETWYPTADGLVFGDAPFDSVDDGRVLRVADGKEVRRLPDSGLVLAVRGGRMVLMGTRVAGSDVVVQLYVDAVGADQATRAVDVGGEAPDQVSLAGDVVAAVTGDRRVLVLRAG
ncbi:Hsp70 family protein [Actinomycetes bacterium KLBMP 9797]